MSGARTLAWLCFFACVAALSITPIANNDIFIHLRTGEYVLEHGQVPGHDPYSFTAADRDYVAHEWLAGVAFYLVHWAFGITGLILFKTLIVAAAYALLLLAAQRAGASFPVALCASVLVLTISSARWVERPHVFSYLMTALYAWLFFRYREQRDVRWLYLIVPADILWTNLHGGFIAGIALLLVLALGESAMHLRARARGEPLLPRHLVVLLLLAPACLCASLLNPYGYRALTFPFELTSLGLFMKRVYEWQPPYHENYNHSTMFFLYVIYCGALFVAFFLRFRARAPGLRRSAGAALSIATVALCATLLVLFAIAPATVYRPEVVASILYALLAVFCLFVLVELRSVDLTLAGIVAFFFALSLRHNRAVTDAVLGTFPVLAASASFLVDRKPSSARTRRGLLLGGAAALLVVAAGSAAWGYRFDFAGTRKDIGLGIVPTLPTCAVEFMARESFTGNAFVSYSDAALVIGGLYPKVKVNVDSRNDVYLEDRYQEYLDAFTSPAAMDAYLGRYPVDFFFLPYAFRVSEIFDPLEASGRWAGVYYDDGWFILVRRTPERREWIERHELRVLRPFESGIPEARETSPTLLLAEAERTIDSCPRALLGHLRKSEALRSLGRAREAVDAASAAVALEPQSVLAASYLAAAYAAAGEHARAIELLEAALARHPDDQPAQELLRLLRGR